ncbi:MAG: SWIM zinc finger family protein [Ilumatobacteraceae bacterium]
MTDDGRWTVEQVASVAPSPRSMAAADPLAVAARWVSTGADDRAAWGRCRGSGAEPYDTAVDHVDVAWRCTCPSRKLPCKHALALLLLWVRNVVGEGRRPESVETWIEGRDRRTATERHPTHIGTDGEPRPGVGADPDAEPGATEPTDRRELDRARDERVANMLAGLAQLDRWLEDRMRTGLGDPALARYSTWDELAARLVDARAGALANRIRRLAGLVGAGADWHADVLAELGFLHLIAQAGRRLPDLPGPLADAVATASGWQVRHADVLAGVPDTDQWFVAGRSDVREDRIEVRRVWLHGVESGRWALLLSFAAYQQSLDDSFTVGTVVHADLHRYPGGSLRALAGRRHADPLPFTTPTAMTVGAACDAVGRAVAGEPWLERHPATIRAVPSVSDGRWVLTDDRHSLPLIGGTHALATVLAVSAGAMADITVEWTPWGVQPLTVHLGDRTVDIGPRADPSFVGAA